MHLLRQPIHLSASVAEDDGLGDGDRFVEIAESIQLPFFLFDSDVELLDTFQGQLVPLDENPNGLSHELLGHFEHICGHGSREKNDLGVLREKLEDFVDLVFETTGQHLIGFIETEDFDVVGPEGPAIDHIEDPTGSADDDVNTLPQLAHILADVGSTDTGVTFNVHIVAESNDDLLNLLSKLASRGEDESLGGLDREVELLEDGDGEGCGLASAGLSLSDDIVALDDRDDRTLLNGGRTLETIGEKTSGNRQRHLVARTRKRRYRGEVLASDPCCRNCWEEDPSTMPGSSEGRKRRTYRRFDPSWTQFRYLGYLGEVLCRIRVNTRVCEARNGWVSLGRHDFAWLRRERDEFLFFVRVGEMSTGEYKLQKFSVPLPRTDPSVVADALPSQQKN